MRRLISAVCLLGILCGVAGPVYDHCFAQRDPFHSHLAPGPVAQHIEHYQLPAHHGGDLTEAQEPGDSGLLAVRNLEARDGGAFGDLLAHRQADMGLLPDMVSLYRPGPVQIPPSANPAPPHPPPRIIL